MISYLIIGHNENFKTRYHAPKLQFLTKEIFVWITHLTFINDFQSRLISGNDLINMAKYKCKLQAKIYSKSMSAKKKKIKKIYELEVAIRKIFYTKYSISLFHHQNGYCHYLECDNMICALHCRAQMWICLFLCVHWRICYSMAITISFYVSAISFYLSLCINTSLTHETRISVIRKIIEPILKFET